jgi:hypothetical protein
MQHTYGDYKKNSNEIGATCAAGALVYALSSGEYFDPHRLEYGQDVFYCETLSALAYCVPGLDGGVADFNDLSSTRKKDVIALFECAIVAPRIGVINE